MTEMAPTAPPFGTESGHALFSWLREIRDQRHWLRRAPPAGYLNVFGAKSLPIAVRWA
jgi:hypothetical protein